MRQLATKELETVSGGNDALIFMGLVGFTAFTAFTIGLIASTPPRQPICQEIRTPNFDPYTGIYLGDVVDKYCY